MEPKRVLFVCIGNACRSQMAEAFARVHGSDVMIPASAGLAPALGVMRNTQRAMSELGIDLSDHFPKSVRHLGRAQFDLIVNMSGVEVPPDLPARTSVIEWDVEDPVFMKYEDHCKIRDQIETLVMKLILELRQEQAAPGLRGPGSGRQEL
jgi:arsenate reductase